jgi:hypothetical protein
MVLVALPSAFWAPLYLLMSDFMKPLLLFILSLLAIYTYAKKFWAAYAKDLSYPVWAILISIIVGFMMVLLVQELGFLVVAFIALMGFSARFRECKMVNLATNFGSICLFMLKGR